jgi:hypothetical protein
LYALALQFSQLVCQVCIHLYNIPLVLSTGLPDYVYLPLQDSPLRFTLTHISDVSISPCMLFIICNHQPATFHNNVTNVVLVCGIHAVLGLVLGHPGSSKQSLVINYWPLSPCPLSHYLVSQGLALKPQHVF